MPKIRRILSHVRVEIAGKVRKCHRDTTHAIHQGESCLAIYDGPRNARKNYCRECAKAILACARADFDELVKSLANQGPLFDVAAVRVSDG
jgi:hypothetical protein